MLIGSIVALFLAAILFLGFFLLPSLATAQQEQQQQQTTTTTTSPPSSLSITTTPPLTPEEQAQQNRLQNVIAATTLNLQETQKQIAGVVFTPRWSEPVWVNANSVSVLIAYCLPGEFADAGQEILGGFELEVLESYALALPQGFMAWMAVVGNEDLQNGRRFPAALGVICASDLNRADTRILSPQEQQEINNINQQFVNIQNTQITDIDNVINIINNVTANETATTEPVTPPPPPPPTDDTGDGGGGGTPPIQCPIGSFYNSTSGQCELRTFEPEVQACPIGSFYNATSRQCELGEFTPADTTPPDIGFVIQGESGTYITYDPAGHKIYYGAYARDDVDGEVLLEITSNILSQDNVGGDISLDCNPPPRSIIPVGVTTVQCTAVDQAGNIGTKSFTITIELQQPLRVEIVISNTVERLNYTEFLLEAKVTGGTEPYTYDWPNSTRLPSLPDNMLQVTVSPGATSIVLATVTDSKNQTASDSIQLTVGESMEPIPPGELGEIQENATAALDTDGGTPTQPLDDTGPPPAPAEEEEETVEEEEAPVEEEEQPPAEEQPPPATEEEPPSDDAEEEG